jgi:hypothetical protein
MCKKLSCSQIQMSFFVHVLLYQQRRWRKVDIYLAVIAICFSTSLGFYLGLIKTEIPGDQRYFKQHWLRLLQKDLRYIDSLRGRACDCTLISSERHLSLKALKGSPFSWLGFLRFLRHVPWATNDQSGFRWSARGSIFQPLFDVRQLSALILQAILAFRTLVQRMHRLLIAEETTGIWAFDVIRHAVVPRRLTIFGCYFAWDFQASNHDRT